MTAIARFVILAVAAVCVPAAASLAQSSLEPAASDSNQAEVLDRLLGRLHQADDADSAKLIEQAVWKVWMQSGSPTVDLLVQQAEKAIEQSEYPIAISILTAAIKLEPEYAEAWNRRATAYFLNRQFALSLADAKHTLELEPRHFAALAGIGVLYQEMGEKRAALDAFRRALNIHPFLPVARRAVKELEFEVEQDI